MLERIGIEFESYYHWSCWNDAMVRCQHPRVLLASMLLVVAPATYAQTFSVELGTLDTVGGMPPGDDILIPGPLPVVTGGSPLTIDIDAFTYGRSGVPGTDFYFSVDVASTGISGAGAVDFEVASGGSGEQNVDVFRTDLVLSPGFNAHVHDGNGAGPGGVIFPLGLGEPATTSFDGVDGYDTRSTPGPAIYWSWGVAGIGPPPSASLADILLSATATGFTGASTVFASETALGLTPGDNIDALEVFDNGTPGIYDPGDVILFSLSPFSPSLGAFSAGPADILGVGPGGLPTVVVPAVGLGLLPNDNVTALSVIPEPATTLPLSLMVAGVYHFRRRRRQTITR